MPKPFDRFWAKVQKDQTDCWLFTGHCNPSGHGRFWFERKLWQAHRFSYSHYRGPIPEGLQVLHTCDVPNCVNPDHLWLGTNYDNIQDKVSKGRCQDMKGEAHPRAKLSESDVHSIRKKYAAGGITQKSLSEKYGVTRGMIGYIVRGDHWSHV